MAKKKDITFLCKECGDDFSMWYGKCPSCGAFNSLAEFREAKIDVGKTDKEGVDLVLEKGIGGKGQGVGTIDRLETGISEFDRVLGGGLFPGALILFGGHPGIGKSTLALQVFALVEGSMYFSGEESQAQVMNRLQRLTQKETLASSSLARVSSDPNLDCPIKSGNDNGKIFSTNSIEDVVMTVQKHKPPLVVIDSIQMIGREGGNFGSQTQIRENAEVLLKLAKTTGSVILLIGHVTKNDELAGPKVLEHLVDTVLYLEGDRNTDLRILKSPKNRFGSTMEVGVFQMQSQGLMALENPSEFFINQRLPGSHGSSITVVREGVRNFLLEIQALTIKTNFGNPRRTAHGVDISKLHLLLAVVSKFTPFKCYEYDTYLNVVGGMRVQDPASDLAICASIISSRLEQEIPADTILFGEVGLSGEVRSIPHIESRIHEAAKLGFKNIITPRIPKGVEIKGKTEIHEVSSVGAIVKILWKS